MTREAKIGLLVGMGSIIFIGILISDHLSVAQQQNNAILAQSQPDQVYVPATLPAPLTDIQLSNTDELIAPLSPQDLQLNRTAAPSDTQAFQPDVLVLSTPSILEQDGTASTGAPAQSATQPIASTPATEKRNDRVYHVQTGDTLWSIAAKHYGDGSYYQSIYEANRDKMKSPTDLRTGVRLVIPDRGGSTTSPDTNSSPADHAPAQPIIVAAADAPRASSKTYVVQTGDTLGEISQQVYGTSKKWRDLYNLNKDRINNPDVLIVGTELRVNR